MVIKQLVFKKRPHYFFSSSILLIYFDKTKLKITQHDCVDRFIYHIYLSYHVDLLKNKKVTNI